MKKYIWMIPVLLLACKKNNDTTPKITIKQLPSKISIFTVDTATLAETLQYEMDLFYNEDTRKFDSIILAGTVYKFDYSVLSSENKILLNYTNASMPYKEILFDPAYYNLTAYKEIQPSPGISTIHTLQYDANRITGYALTTTPAANNFSKTYTYKNDTAFIHSERVSDLCASNDTILNSYYDMSTALSWLLFTDVDTSCGSMPLMMRTLPVSSYPAKLPLKMISGDMQIDYTYIGDTNSRLAEALLVRKTRSSGVIAGKTKIKLVY